MDSLWPILAGVAMGFALVLLLRLGLGRPGICTRCGQQHWVSKKNIDSVTCKKCGGPLKIQKKQDNKPK